MNYSRFPDETLIELIKHQDAEAFEELYQRHCQIVHNLVVRIVSERATADEIVQESFWQAWKKAKDFRGSGAPAAWLYRIARNKSLDFVRKRKRELQPRAMAADANGMEQAAPPALPTVGVSLQPSLVEKQVTQDLDRQHLLRALTSIPGDQRICLELAYYEGFSQSQIAQQLGIPLGTVKTRVRMGLEKLEHILRAAGYKEEDF